MRETSPSPISPALMPAAGAGAAERLSCPDSKVLRQRLRGLAADTVAGWRAGELPAKVRSAAGLRAQAVALVQRAGARPEHVGWVMVTLVSEYWRERLASGPSGRRLLLLPDCPHAADEAAVPAVAGSQMPRACGPGCGVARLWAAARDGGWVVQPTAEAIGAIGSLLTGQYDGILGVAKLEHLQKAFAMLPAFSLPIAAVPFQPAGAAGSCGSCGEAAAASALDVEWVMGLLGSAGGALAGAGDERPLLKEAAELFSPQSLQALAERLGRPGVFGPTASPDVGHRYPPLAATAGMAGEFLTRGGKFLRPFIALAAFDAIVADGPPGSVPARRREAVRDAAVAIEIFHKASLVHDDIEDADAMRYGQPTLHRQHGIPAAINAGDYMLGLGYSIVASLPGVDAETQRDLLAMLADAHLRLAQGQGAELWWRDAGDKRLSPEEALAIYGLKTSPAFEVAVAMGIRLAGLQPTAVGAVDRYALHVGTGFQVLNDLKDWSGDLENNRRAAGDLLGGRPTLMWALAIERLPAAGVEQLFELAAAAGRADASESLIAEAIAQTRSLYEEAGVFSRAASIVEAERGAARAAVATCRQVRLRKVLEFLLDVAVPENAAAEWAPRRG